MVIETYVLGLSTILVLNALLDFYWCFRFSKLEIGYMRETILADKIVQREIYVSTLLSLLLMKFLILKKKEKKKKRKKQAGRDSYQSYSTFRFFTIRPTTSWLWLASYWTWLFRSTKHAVKLATLALFSFQSLLRLCQCPALFRVE